MNCTWLMFYDIARLHLIAPIDFLCNSIQSFGAVYYRITILEDNLKIQKLKVIKKWRRPKYWKKILFNLEKYIVLSIPNCVCSPSLPLDIHPLCEFLRPNHPFVLFPYPLLRFPVTIIVCFSVPPVYNPTILEPEESQEVKSLHGELRWGFVACLPQPYFDILLLFTTKMKYIH